MDDSDWLTGGCQWPWLVVRWLSRTVIGCGEAIEDCCWFSWGFQGLWLVVRGCQGHTCVSFRQCQNDKFFYWILRKQSLVYHSGQIQWWANIIKWTRMNIRIYSDASLCTKRISKYIRIPYIYRTDIRIYLYSGNSTNMNTNNIRGSFYSNICTPH